jgi:hypothetical protein
MEGTQMIDDVDLDLPDPVVFHVGMCVKIIAKGDRFDGHEGILRMMDFTLNYRKMAEGAPRELIPVGMIGDLLISLSELEPA